MVRKDEKRQAIAFQPFNAAILCLTNDLVEYQHGVTRQRTLVLKSMGTVWEQPTTILSCIGANAGLVRKEVGTGGNYKLMINHKT